jgi:hypothetical protein
MLTFASGEVMLCGWSSVLSILSFSGWPAFTLNSVLVKASCFLPSGPTLESGMTDRSIALAAAMLASDVDASAPAGRNAAAGVAEAATSTRWPLFASANSDIITAATMPNPASHSKTTLPFLSTASSAPRKDETSPGACAPEEVVRPGLSVQMCC